MADIILTQADADALIAMEKHRADDIKRNYPSFGGSISVPLLSADGREDFTLDVYRGKINLLKGTYQNRSRQVIVLVRLDFGGPPHRNPDDQEVLAPHIHIYREGYGDKWAMPVPLDRFSDMSNLWRTLENFMTYCNVTQPPFIERGLFI